MFLAVVLVIFTTIVSFFLYLKWTYTYWTRKGLYMFEGKDSTSRISYQAIRNKGLKHGAYRSFFRSHYMPVNLEIVKDILIKNANHFINRGMYCNPKVDPLSATIPQLENEEWKDVRSIVSQIFSPGEYSSNIE